MKTAIQLLYRLRRSLLARLRLKTRGVKVMIFNPAGELLLIRNSYGKSHVFLLPGGGIGWFETPEDAARREVREEVGLRVDGLSFFATYESRAEGKRDTVHLFTAVADAAPTTDSFEIEEAAFFVLENLPETTSSATLRRVAEYRGERGVTSHW
ncbi:MAG TPA: NUDIX domain-containing protein [Allosphingosinicella sp.]|nr:NUDIX domain-containing protein [Allosphingosinicella sp.]